MKTTPGNIDDEAPDMSQVRWPVLFRWGTAWLVNSWVDNNVADIPDDLTPHVWDSYLHRTFRGQLPLSRAEMRFIRQTWRETVKSRRG
jgi:hypothetical protein